MPECHTEAQRWQRPVRASDGRCHEHSPVKLGLMSACMQGVSSQDNGAKRFIVVRERIDTGDG
jgi:hypothetical protein